MQTLLFVVMIPFRTIMLQRSSHFLNSSLQITAQGPIEIDSVLYAIGINNYAVGHRPPVVLFDQLAVCSQLKDVTHVRLFGSTAFDLHWNEAVAFSFNYVVRLAADVKGPGTKCLGRTIKV